VSENSIDPARIAALLEGPRFTRWRETKLWSGETLTARFLATAKRQPDATMLVDGVLHLSFAAALARSSALAAGLAARGIGRGDALACQLPNWWEAAIVFLAAQQLGAHSVPVVPILRAREFSLVLRETAPKAIFTRGDAQSLELAAEAAALGHPDLPLLVAVRSDTARPEQVPGENPGPELLAFEDLLPATFPAAGRDPVVSAQPEDLAAVIYTSGSTAAPKGALHIQQTLIAEIDSLKEAHDLGPGDSVLMPSPLGHISGVIHGILVPALLGTSAVLQARWDPGAALLAIESNSVTYMIGAPVFLQEMLRHPSFPERDLSSLRLFSCGGAPVPPELLAEASKRMPELVAKRVYGSSEFPTISTTNAEDARTRGIDSEGKALRGVEIRIVTATGTPATTGQEGEIRAYGPECFIGYANPALDRETFDADGFLCTGDLGVLDDAGYLRITGRLKDIIVRKGEKISAREVEERILEHADVEEVAVIALPDQERGELACACIRLAEGAALHSIAGLSAFLRDRGLTPQKLPERMETLTELPRGASGKVDKRELVRRFTES
jgi:cyclohexanecarboxylate-CoA ligase